MKGGDEGEKARSGGGRYRDKTGGDMRAEKRQKRGEKEDGGGAKFKSFNFVNKNSNEKYLLTIKKLNQKGRKDKDRRFIWEEVQPEREKE